MAVPDLEGIAVREYLAAHWSERGRGGGAQAGSNEWMMLEMYDQTMREKTGGEMAEYLEKTWERDWGFCARRLAGGRCGVMTEGQGKTVDATGTVSAGSVGKSVAVCWT